MALTKTPIELSSTPGIVDNSNATAITIDSSENVLVGKTSNTISAAGAKLGTGGSNFTRSGAEVVYFNRTTNDGALATFAKDGTTVGAIATWDGDLAVGQENVAFKFNDGSNEILPWSVASNLNRDNAFNLGSSSSRFKDLYLSGGVVFGDAGGSGTSSSNTFDSYEEGTWTPALNGSGYTFGTHTGTYVKVGRVCTVVGKLVVSGVGTNTSNMGSLTGFPFAALNTTNQFQTGVAREITTTGRLYVVQVNVNLTSGGINSMDGVASGSNEIFTTGEYCFSLTYITT